MRTLFIVTILACGLLLQGFARAEESAQTQEQLRAQVVKLQNEVRDLKAQLALRKTDLYAKYAEVKKKEYDFQAKVMDLNAEMIQTQWLQTYTVMTLVVLVVIAGISFSAFQLWTSIRVAGVQLNSDLEMSAKSVRVTSSVVGVVVLVISLVFLYIYTEKVYQLRLINLNAPDLAEPKPSDLGLSVAE